MIPMIALILAATLQPSNYLQLNVDGTTRSALIYAPTTQDTAPPIIFCYHGYYGSADQASAWNIQAYWPEAVVVYPQGLPYSPAPGAPKSPGWDGTASENCYDIRFFDALYKSVMATYHGNPRKVFAVGYSNGGEMVYGLLKIRGGRLAGAASVECFAGGQYLPINPKPFFITVGDYDSMVPPSFLKKTVNDILKANNATGEPTQYGSMGHLYTGRMPTLYWNYPGGHEFPTDCIPTMVQFFKSIGK